MSHSDTYSLPRTAFAPESIAEALAQHGACLIEGFPAPAHSEQLRTDLQHLAAEGQLKPAAIGRAGSHQERSDLRGDNTLWLDDPRCSEAAEDYLTQLDTLRSALNRLLFLGLKEVEAHYALYSPGTRYTRHRDRFRDSDARVVTLVSYLNPEWQADDGGQLRLYRNGGHIDVYPHISTSLCFLSELEHEVLPTHRDRLSIAAWLRR
ncbi:2OG-Fe(II) oxygenase [Lysobacteraceae bacterium NML75-0749]|nr:2OG-Fe(II) oxygenase [Xanthomonadaceae bacterium NML75-0749]PJK03470.1 2OG-Fe(II) oxygenase [Xanthomonadaceae bacterium NML91-0268]PJK07292.1 2OG-Fe(II) oxygenase [Xanthomonadaceae bacterium NML71-0210]